MLDRLRSASPEQQESQEEEEPRYSTGELVRRLSGHFRKGFFKMFWRKEDEEQTNQASREKKADASPDENPEILEVVDAVMHDLFPQHMLRGKGMDKAARLFEKLEGMRLNDAEKCKEKLAEYLEEEAGAKDEPAAEPVTSREMTIGRNDPCPCGSGHKFKKCCMRKKKD